MIVNVIYHGDSSFYAYFNTYQPLINLEVGLLRTHLRYYFLANMIASRRPFKNDSKPYFMQCDDMQPLGHYLLQSSVV